MATTTVGAASLQAIGRFCLKQPARSGAVHRTGAPVRRDSVEAGTFEDSFYTKPAPGDTDRILKAARKALEAGRRLRRDARVGGRQLTSSERLIASLTNGAVRVLEELLTLARLNEGRVFPTYDYLAQATSLGRVTVARALRILDDIGFIIRQRRFKRVEAKGPGPRFEQTSNVYRAFLPKMVLPYLPRQMRPVPIPVDEEQRSVDRALEQRAMLSSLSCKELGRASVADGALAKILAKLGAALDAKEREFHVEAQPLSDSYIYEQIQSCPSRATKLA